MTAIVVIVFIAAVISEIATSSRQLWSFARDGGLPFSSWVAKVSGFSLSGECITVVLIPKKQQIQKSKSIPLNAIIVSLVLAFLVSLINLGSNVALNAINSVTISALLSSYILTIGCLLYRRLSGQPLPARRWSLGRAGMAINIASLIFLLPLFVFAFFPLAVDPAPADMNWGILMFGGLILSATVYYVFLGRKQYVAPVTLVKSEHYEM